MTIHENHNQMNYANMAQYGQPGASQFGMPAGQVIPQQSPGTFDTGMFDMSSWTQGTPGMQNPSMPNLQVPGQQQQTGPGFWSMEGAFGGANGGGWASPAIAGASALMNGYLGMKQYGLAKDTLKENKRQFQLNYDSQKKLTNSRLQDRQQARVASNPGAYRSVGDYMKENGVK